MFIDSFRADEKMLFRNKVNTDGFSVDFIFARKKNPKNVLNQQLHVEDFRIDEVDEFFRPVAVDPGVASVLTASYGHGSACHEIRKFFSNEYYAATGSPRRNKYLDKQKQQAGIKDIETGFPTAKIVDPQQYRQYVAYFFRHRESLFRFYGSERAQSRFYDYQGRQRAREEMTNVLINGGRRYNRSKRKKTKRNRKTRKQNRTRRKAKKRRQNRERAVEKVKPHQR